MTDQRRDLGIRIQFGCPTIEAGLIDIVNPGNPITTEKRVVIGQSQVVTVVPRVFPKTRTEGSNTFGPFKNSEKIVKNLSSSSNSVLKKTPGKYSGEMRKVVQAIIGLGEPVSYNYTFSQTHGIYKASDGIRWLIQIDNTGVLAKKLNICEETISTDNLDKEIKDTLGYKPVAVESPFPPGASLSSAKGNGSVIELLDATGIAPFYDKIAFFSACGWAFNSTGSQVSNTCFEIDLNNHIFTYLYTLSITETIVEGEVQPSSASLIEVESGFAYGPKISHVKFPDEFLESLISFDTFRGVVSGPAQTSDGPMYVFYDNDALTIVRHSGEVNLGAQLKDNGDTDFSLDFSSYNLFISATAFLPRIQSFYGKENFVNYNYTENKSSMPTVDSFTVQPTDLNDGAGDRIPIDPIIELPFYAHNDTNFLNPSKRGVGNKVYQGHGFYRTVTDDNDTNGAMVFVPFGDREAIYVFEQNTKDAISQVLTEQETFIAGQSAVGDKQPAISPPAPLPNGDFYYINSTGTVVQLEEDGLILLTIKNDNLKDCVPLPVPFGDATTGPFLQINTLSSFIVGNTILSVTNPVDGIYSTKDTLKLIASGAINVSLKTDQGFTNFTHDYFRFISPETAENNPQVLIMGRDAFSGDFFASPDIDDIDPVNYLVQGLGDYATAISQFNRVSLTGYSFMGVP